MGKKFKVERRAAHGAFGPKINACQIPFGEEGNVWISVDQAVIFTGRKQKMKEISVKCCHCWKVGPQIAKKMLNYEITKKMVENVQIRTKKLKNGGILVY